MFDYLETEREHGLFFVPDDDEGGGGAEEDTSGAEGVFEQAGEGAEESSEEGGEAAGEEEQGEEEVDPSEARFAAIEEGQQKTNETLSRITQLLQPPEKDGKDDKADEKDLDKPMTKRDWQAIQAKKSEDDKQSAWEKRQEAQGNEIYKQAVALKASIPQIFSGKKVKANDGSMIDGLSVEYMEKLVEVDQNPVLLAEIVAKHFFGKGVAALAPKRKTGAKIDAGAGTGKGTRKRVEDMTTAEIDAAEPGALSGG